MLCNWQRQNPDLDMQPRIFFFAGKAAPAYRLAKLIISSLTIWWVQSTAILRFAGRSRWCFTEYGVSLAEHLIPCQ